MTPVLVDGEASLSVPAGDRGLAFGDGVFRTLHVRAGRPLNWQWHYRRLRADCEMLRLPVPEERVLLGELALVAPANAVAKIMVTRGASGRGYAIPEGRTSSRIVAAFPAPVYHPALARDGVIVRRCELKLSQQPRLAGAKTLNRLENVLARSEWSDAAIAEGLLADSQERVIEGTMSNVFIVKDGVASTPDLSRCGVVGAQRERVRELLQLAAGIECRVRDLGWADVEDADEFFLTNSLIGVWPVASFGEQRWKPGPVTKCVQQLIVDDDARD
ncbi:MAG: aminodeoxychorismate lyase [Usitatibacter sp.]